MPHFRLRTCLLLLASAVAAVTCPAPSAALGETEKTRTRLTLDSSEDHGAINGAAFSADSTRLALFQDGRRVTVWDTRTGKRLTTINSPGFTKRHLFAVSADGQAVFAWNAVSGSCAIWDVRTAKARTVFTKTGDEKDTSGVCTGAISGNGKRIATVHDGGGCATHIRVWDAVTGKEMWNHNNAGGNQIVFAVSFSPDGKILAAGAQDGRTKLFDAETGKLVATLAGRGWVSGLNWSEDGKRLATSRRTSKTNMVEVWDVPTRKVVGSIGLPEKMVGPVLSPDGELVAVLNVTSAGRISLNVWDMRGKAQVSEQTLPGARALAWTPDGKAVVVLSERGKHQLQTFPVPGVRR